jgi:hypothetical protein
VVSGVPVGGGNATVVAMGQASPFGLASDGTYAYWTNSTVANPGHGIAKAPLSGVGPVIYRAVNQQSPVWVTLDQTTIYWLDSNANTVQATAK